MIYIYIWLLGVYYKCPPGFGSVLGTQMIGFVLTSSSIGSRIDFTLYSVFIARDMVT